MKYHNIKSKLTFYSLMSIMVVVLVSCVTGQSLAGYDDGIYADEQENKKRIIIIQDSERSHDAQNENYFSKEFERLEVLNGTDIITDIENYQSDELNDNQIIEDTSSFSYNDQNSPWGYDTANDIIININTFPNYRLGWNFNTYWGDPFWDGPLGWNRWSWNWGYNPWWHPYQNFGWGWNNWAWNNRWYCPPYLNRNTYYRNRFRGFGNRYYSRNGLAYHNSLTYNIRKNNYSYSNRNRRNNAISRIYPNRTLRNLNGNKTRNTRLNGVKRSRANTKGSNVRTGGYKNSKSTNNSKRSRYSNNRSSNGNKRYSNSNSNRSSSKSFSSGSRRSSRGYSSSSSSSGRRGSSRRR